MFCFRLAASKFCVSNYLADIARVQMWVGIVNERLKEGELDRRVLLPVLFHLAWRQPPLSSSINSSLSLSER